MFDPNAYAQLAAIDPNAAAAYLATFAAPAATFTPPPPVQAQAQAQGFAQAQAAPQQVAARGTLEDFFNQPSGGGGPSVTSKFFKTRVQGSWLQLTVLADVTHADVMHQKTPQGALQYFKKNNQDDLTRPKLVLVVKVAVTGSSDGTHTQLFPDGVASLWLKKGPVTDDLIRAMTVAGDPSGYPKGGAQMVMVSAGEKASNNATYSATKLYTFQYAMPAEEVAIVPPTSPASVPTAALTPPPAPVAASAPAPAPVPTVTATAPIPGAVPSAAAAPAPTMNPAPSLTTPTAPAAAPIPEATFTPPPPPAPEVTDDPKAAERAALLAKLQGVSA